MRVLHVIPSMSFRYGGPTHAMIAIEKALRPRGVEVVVATTDADGVDHLEVKCDCPISIPFATCWYFRRTIRCYTVSFPLLVWLRQNVGNFDAVHIHALFSFAPAVAAWCARAAGVPFVVRPLGVLSPYGMTQRRPFLKNLSLGLIERRILEAASAVHFTSAMEEAEAQLLGLNFRSAVIPLGIETCSAPAMERCWRGGRALRLLFLSRLDPKKNLEALLHAMACLVSAGRNLHLTVAGDGPSDYVRKLKSDAERLGIAGHVDWLGHVNGIEKTRVLEAADVFVLPSFSENFGIAVVEALAAGLPCIVSRGIAIAEQIGVAKAGWLVGTDAASIAETIGHLIDRPYSYARMSAVARQLAEETFSLSVMGARLEVLYRDITGSRCGT